MQHQAEATCYNVMDSQPQSAGTKSTIGISRNVRPGASALAVDRSTKSKKSRASSRRQLIDIIDSKLLKITNKKPRSQQTELCSIILDLVSHADRATRRILADRIATLGWVTRDLVTHLAKDEINISRAILTRHTALNNSDLINIARSKTIEHRIAIASRDNVDHSVSRSLVAFGEAEVIEALLANTKANIDETTYRYLISEADRFPSCETLLLRRNDLPPHAQMVLLRKLSIKLKDQIAGNDCLEANYLIDVIAFLASSVSEEDGKSPVSLIADALAPRPRLAIGFLQCGETQTFYEVLSDMAQMPSDAVREHLLSGNFSEIASLTDQAGFTLDAFFALVHLLHQAQYTEGDMKTCITQGQPKCSPV